MRSKKWQCLNLKCWWVLLCRIWHEIAGCWYKISLFLVILMIPHLAFCFQNPGPTMICKTFVESLGSGCCLGNASISGANELIAVSTAPNAPKFFSCPDIPNEILPRGASNLIDSGIFFHPYSSLTWVISSSSRNARKSTILQPAIPNSISRLCASHHDPSSLGANKIETSIFGFPFRESWNLAGSKVKPLCNCLSFSLRSCSTLNCVAATSLSVLAASENSSINPAIRTSADNLLAQASRPFISFQSKTTSPATPKSTSEIPGCLVENSQQLDNNEDAKIIARHQKEDEVASYLLRGALAVLLVSKTLKFILRK